MRYLILIITILLSADSFAQKDTTADRHFIAVQFGGQTMVSLHHEYSFITKNRFKLNTNLGFGINANGNSESGDAPIYGIHSGLICLIEAKYFTFELGLNPTTYFHGPTTFLNLNGWAGVRLFPKIMEGFFLAFGYTPRLYTTNTGESNQFFDATIGAKFGVNF